MNALNHLHTLRGSFSAVSTPICASKYSMEEILYELCKMYTRLHHPDLKILAKFGQVFAFCLKTVFSKVCHFFINFDEILS
jgi:hypothetical protein